MKRNDDLEHKGFVGTIPSCDCRSCAIAERDRLRTVLDSRPAINAGLPLTYIEWSQLVYQADFAAMTQATH